MQLDLNGMFIRIKPQIPDARLNMGPYIAVMTMTGYDRSRVHMYSLAMTLTMNPGKTYARPDHCIAHVSLRRD